MVDTSRLSFLPRYASLPSALAALSAIKPKPFRPVVSARLEFAIVEARVRRATGNVDEAVKSLQASQAEADKYGHGRNSYEIQLVLAELEMSWQKMLDPEPAKKLASRTRRVAVAAARRLIPIFAAS